MSLVRVLDQKIAVKQVDIFDMVVKS